MAPTANPEVLRAIRNTPLLSSSASQLLQVTSDPDHGLSDVIDVVRCDSILTARLLKIVNSAAFSLATPASTIDRAIAFLGTRMVVGIAISDSASELLNKPLNGYESDHGSLWRHELFSALASRAVANLAKVDFGADLAFTAGLLHDIGKAILSEHLKGTCEDVLTDIDSGKSDDYLEGERGILGLDHAQVGYELAKAWKLPKPLQEVILHHHRPAEAEEEMRPMVYAVHLGDIIAMMGGRGTGSDSMQYHLDQGYCQYFDITNNDLACILLEVTEEFNKIEASMASSEGTNP